MLQTKLVLNEISYKKLNKQISLLEQCIGPGMIIGALM